MKFYYTKRSPYARQALIIAIEKNIELELVEVDLFNKPPELLSVNPVGKIPTLVLNDGAALCDSSLICDYFNHIGSGELLIPEEGEQRWKSLNYTFIAKGIMDNTVSMFVEQLNHPEKINTDFISRRESLIEQSLQYFDERVSDIEHFSMPSIALACAIGYINLRFPSLWDDSPCNTLKAWFKNMEGRSSFSKTVPVIS